MVKNDENGFSLIELVVVCAIMITLTGCGLPYMLGAYDKVTANMKEAQQLQLDNAAAEQAIYDSIVNP